MRNILITIVFLLFTVSLTLVASEEGVDENSNQILVSDPNASVHIPDANLRAAIEKALGKPKDATITQAEMATLTTFSADNASIQDITGLESAISLTTLSLYDNAISDLSPLAGLTSLRSLFLYDNAISDLSPLAGLTSLRSLFLYDNAISDLSPLAELTSLTRLSLGSNDISDLSPSQDLPH